MFGTRLHRKVEDGTEGQFSRFAIERRSALQTMAAGDKQPHKREDASMEMLKGKTICSLHFKVEDYDINIFGMMRPALKPTAVLSVFAVGPR